MTSFNPLFYLQQAWNKTHSLWGKVAIVLFYSYIWLGIVEAIQFLLYPATGQGCLTSHATESELMIGRSYNRQTSVFTLGFFLLADRGGIRVSNVGWVTVITVAYVATLMSVYRQVPTEIMSDCAKEIQVMSISLWMSAAWVLVALLAAVMEAKQAPPAGTQDETNTLQYWNPQYYWTRAWNATHSFWGKGALVLFYVWIWIQIIWTIQFLIVPLAGLDCFVHQSTQFAVISSPESTANNLRQLGIMFLGYLVYADKGGIRIWNICLVWVIFAAWCAEFLFGFLPAIDSMDEYRECKVQGTKGPTAVWVSLIWPLVALVMAVVDTAVQDTPTVGEMTPLV